MCGIIGYVSSGIDAENESTTAADGGTGDGRALPVLAEGLRNLEYRGYDSAGVALVEDDDLSVFKQAGVIDDLDLPDDHPATSGVGHTRWSTHGKPTDANAHPHTDCSGDIAVVHNGIIENYDDLRAELDDHEFTSETDTEVVPHLLEEELAARRRRASDGGQVGANADDVTPDGATADDATVADDQIGGVDLVEAVEAVVDRLSGSYAVAVTIAGREEVVVARQDSPLVLGVGEDANFVASDVTAFVEHTRDVVYLEDGDVARVTAGGVDVRSDGEYVERETKTVDWEAEAAEKGGYDHYMLKEIHEQPGALRQTLSGRIDEVGGDVDLELDLPESFLANVDEIQVVACGTSYHAGLYARRLLESFADVRVTVEVASEYEFQGGRDPWETLVVAVTQSGETADTLSAMRKAAKAGARTLAVTNTVGSTAAREADDALYIRAGPEIGVAATKTFAAQVTALSLFTVHVGRRRGTLTSERAGRLLENLRGLPGAVQQLLDASDRLEAVATEYVDEDAYFFVGRQLGSAVALEGALKLKEIAYVHAEGFPSGELKHGTLALVTENTPVLTVLTEGARPGETLNNVKEVESRGAPVIGFSSYDAAANYLDVEIPIPDLGVLEPLVANVGLQLFAYHVANELGRAIDKPRNLAKSVTVE
ncbi:glutamine--fructose-6-phosphate transaminase (isomerizing) [Halorubellus sp. JP-L1]|uniref:glutamine--fructose-6-phosphate transaminase (isomerizing) n=1 Tax=Halorubellus sp. JP-L1 TaxID=2715753 RepID=UPI00140E419F|nr:glutamine--fructose-6-phosphate transaminase (isomerizing) [Halorubellus sp. JP-L1]NHN40970.1 glutamine--fructose-6-phosphate transaminase (isomerizing) [Halorubellus sp. JP-L1]